MILNRKIAKHRKPQSYLRDIQTFCPPLTHSAENPPAGFASIVNTGAQNTLYVQMMQLALNSGQDMQQRR